ncbi:unnamed protein product [Penicillium glandicola]
MARPLVSPLQWRQLHQALCPKTHMLRHNGAQACTARAIANNSNTTTSKRPFHTTQSRSIVGPNRQSPSVRKQNRRIRSPEEVYETPGGVGLDRDGFWNGACAAHVEPTLAEFKQAAGDIYKYYRDSMPPGVNLATYMDVCEQLIRLSHLHAPTASQIRSISTDVDAVFRIAVTLADFQLGIIYQWALTGCAKAKSRRALVTLVNRYIKLKGVDIYRDTESIAQVKDLALKDEYPHAIMLYAKLLIWRGENTKAIELLEQKIMPYLQPTSKVPPHWEDITLNGALGSPFRLYAVAVEKEQGLDGIRRVMRRAATEFHDPVSMNDLAITLLEKEDPDRYVIYERFMLASALGGHAPATFFLANLYYRISQGEFTTEAERHAKEREKANATRGAWLRPFEPIANWVYMLFNQPLERETYRNLAIDWYELAFDQGNNEAGFILAMLLREDGEMEKSREVYNLTAQRGLPTSLSKKGLEEMKNKWEDQTFNPGLPPKLLRLT